MPSASARIASRRLAPLRRTVRPPLPSLQAAARFSDLERPCATVARRPPLPSVYGSPTAVDGVLPHRPQEGPFQSDALLVPENCLFDHIHNQTKCWQFDRWNATAADSCRERGLALRSFAMLLPCGISLFSGVEFVCCPKHFKDNGKMKKPLELAVAAAALKGKEQKILEAAQQQQMVQQQPPQLPEEDDDEDDDEEEEDELPEDELSEDDEDEDADQEQDQEQQEQDDAVTDEEDETEEGAGDDYDDDDEEDEGAVDKEQDASSAAPAAAALPSPTAAPATASGVGSQAATPVPTPDPYFTHFDPRIEHQAYKDAQQRLEEQHREKVTKVMKDWSDLEERYQDMRASDPRAADDFKRRMTQRFQMTVQALEEEGDAEKHQLVAMHQQRVAAHIKERKKDAMTCYTRALSDSPPNTHRVQKCLQKLLRALHKDRHHTISHYRHLLVSSFEQAEREKAATLEHLTEIDRTVNQSLQMLERYPELRTKIGQLMEDYIQALRSKDETPGSLLAMTRDAEAAILEKYRADVAAKQEEKERQRQLEKQRKEQRKKERAELSRQQQQQQQQDAPAEAAVIPAEEDAAVAAVAPQPAVQAQAGQQAPPVQPAAYSSAAPPESETAAVHHQEEPPARVAHAQTHDVSHGEATFSVRREVYHRENKSIYFTLAFAGITLMAAVIVGIAVLRRRSARSPQNQGFVEVDQAATPEERHVANMQINGYENPTYKYFEVKE
ncbi:amyloid-beta-like protein [Schistocerca cancellata]|uniref:amyloid-beta-like protein n=1 Tax=Schistocerca cancellata TaxID=274614 RepID=UPI0021193D82|nr:amyloid-beta-like protein [Schistocerca cancellata]